MLLAQAILVFLWLLSRIVEEKKLKQQNAKTGKTLPTLNLEFFMFGVTK